MTIDHQLVLASVDRAGDHAVVIGVVLAIAAAGGLIYGSVRPVAKGRAARTRTRRGPGT